MTGAAPTPLGRWALVILVVLGLAGLGIRLVDLDAAPHGYWTVRQYNAPLIARGMYLTAKPDATPEERELGEAHLGNAFQGEPPIMEWIAAKVYGLTRAESFWPLRVSAVLSWVLGGIFLIGIARRFTDDVGVVVTSAVFWLLPHGITASRSLQPDPMMLMGLLAALLAVVRYQETPTLRRWLVAALVSGLAIVVKPGMSVFAISLAYLFLELARVGIVAAAKDWKTCGFYALAAAPTAIYLLTKDWSGPSLGKAFYEREFNPALIPTLYFWKGWLSQLFTIFGPALMAVGAWGLLHARRSALWWLLPGWFLGYVALGFLRSAVMPSHDYFHLQGIPLWSLGIGVVGAAVFQAVPGRALWKSLTAAGLAIVAWGLQLGRDPYLRADKREIDEYVALAGEIGDAVDHSTNIVMLDYDFGVALRYFGRLEGWAWPLSDAAAFHAVVGRVREDEDITMKAADRFARYFAVYRPDYFVICRAMQELDIQPGLREFLYAHPVVAETKRYAVFDLRAKETP